MVVTGTLPERVDGAAPKTPAGSQNAASRQLDA